MDDTAAPSINADPAIIEQILALCHENPQGIPKQELEQRLHALPTQEVVNGINRLLAEERIRILASRDKSQVNYFYQEVPPEEASKFRGLTHDHRLIYQLIEKEGDMGIWSRDLKTRSGLQQTQLTKVLKTLEGRKLIKAVKPVGQRNKKVYMLFHLEPNVQIKGDVWYTENQEFDTEFIRILAEQIFKMISSKGCLPIDSIHQLVSSSGISKVPLTTRHIQSIVDTLVYDGLVEPVKAQEAQAGCVERDSVLYKPTKLSLPPNGHTATPCGTCPVFSLCSDQGDITPYNCPYLKEWLLAQF